MATDTSYPVPLNEYKEIARFSMPVTIRPELGEDNGHRIHNMKLCCRKIDGTVLKPGSVFSLERCIGEPTSANGFKDGPVITKGKQGRGSGGGICQISTILFNTALLGNLPIVEKHNHSTDIWGDRRMIGLGRDACFVYLRRDLAFRNNTRYPILLRMRFETETMTISGWLMVPRAAAVETVSIESAMIKKKQVRPGTADNKTTEICIVLTKRYVEGEIKRRVTFSKKERYGMVRDAGLLCIFALLPLLTGAVSAGIP